MQPLSRDREENQGGVTKINWDQIAQVQASERNPKEFTISTIPPNRKKGQGGNTQQVVYQCKERNRLLTELVHKLHIRNNKGTSQMTENVQHQSDIYQPDSKIHVEINIHPTVLQVIVRNVDQVRIKQQKKKNCSQQKISQEESKNLTDQEGAIDGVSSFQDEVYYLQEDEDGDEEPTVNQFESDITNLNDNGNVLTPFKGSMLGGIYLGDGEESNTGNIIQQERMPRQKQHFIYLCEIERVIAITNQMIIIKKNQEIDKFIFQTEEKMKEALNLMKKNHKDHFKTSLFYFNLQAYEQDKIFNEIEFLRKNKTISYQQDVTSFTWDGQITGLKIELDENYIYEVEKSQQRVRKRCLLRDLELIRIVDKYQNYNLVLLFNRETEMVLKLPTLQERERLLSAILTLRNFVIPSTGQIDQLTILVNQKIDISQKILGLQPLEQTQFSSEYEQLLFKKLCENISYKDTMKINNLIDEILLNTSFAQIHKLEQRSIKLILKEIQSALEIYLNYEINDTNTADQFFKNLNNNEFVIDYFGKQYGYNNNQENQIQNDQNIKNEQLVNVTEDVENDKLQQFQVIFNRTTKYLNMLNILLNSKQVFGEMNEHEELMQILIKLLASKSPYLSLLASQVLKQISQHHSGTEYKMESLNKKIMIRGKQNGNPLQPSQLNQLENQHLQTLNNFDLGENQCLIHAIFDYLQYFDNIYESQGIIKSLHLYNISNLLRSIFYTRKSTTGKEELQILALKLIQEDQHKILSEQNIQQQQAQGQKQDSKFDDPLRNKPLFHLIDKFSLFNLEYYDIQHMFTFILSESLGYFKKYDLSSLQDFQNYILTYSIQFIWHLYLQMESPLIEQRRLSISVLSKLLYQNSECISLLLRCYPKTLLERVETPIELFTSLAWQDQEWEEFFTIIANKNYDSATEQWNDETRKELKEVLQQEFNEFIEAKNIHKLVIMDGNRKELILPNHEFNRNKQVISRYKNLKWNYMEFQVKYKCLEHQYLVWKYYLTKLLKENNLSERQKPYFTQEIQKPIVFWNELKIRFMSSFNKNEQKIILKNMCVLYNNHYKQLKDLKIIPYIVKLLDSEKYAECHFILLQLIHIALSINHEIANKNMKKFIKYDGLKVLMNSMKLVFKELLRPSELKTQLSQQNPHLVVLNSLSREEYQKLVIQPIAMADQANYTNSETNSRYFKRNSEFVCVGILSLKILDLIFKDMSQVDFVPLPTNREYLMRPTSLAILSQLLMIENIDLTRELTIFLLTHMNNHYTYYQLINSGMVEYLILSLSTRNGDRALEILEKFQEVCIDYNNRLKLGLCNVNDLKMIQEDRLQQEQKIKQLENIQQQNKDNKEIQEEINQKIQQLNSQTILLENSVFLRYLPIPFIKFLYEKGKQEFLKVYKSKSYESPILIWNSDLREILENTIKEHTKNFVKDLKTFADQPGKDIKDDSKFPVYNNIKNQNENEEDEEEKDNDFINIVKYHSIESEVRCGRYYLRVWVNQKKDSKDFFRIPTEEEVEFYKNLQTELRHCIYEEQFQDQEKIIILFKACLLALKTFDNKRNLSLDEVSEIMVETCKNKEKYNDTVKQILNIGVKIIHQAINLNPDNLKLILSKNGVEILGDIFGIILKNSFNSPHLQAGLAKKATQDDEQISSLQELNGNVQGKALEQEDESMQKIQVDIIEAKTLYLCVEYLHVILNTDIQSFIDYPLEQRIHLFKQISRILDLCIHIMPLFSDRNLKYDERKGESTSQAINFQQSRSKNKTTSRSRSKRQKKRHHDNNESKQQFSNKPTSNIVNIQPYNISQQDYYLKKQDDFNFPQKRVNQCKIQSKKDKNIDYKKMSSLDINQDNKDKYFIELIFGISISIFDMTKDLTINPVLHPEIIASGFAWKTVQYLYFYLKSEVYQNKQYRYSVYDATTTLRHLIIFAKEFQQKGAESFVIKNLTKDKEKEIMQKFWKCIERIFAKKILDTTLNVEVHINNNILTFINQDPFIEAKKFMNLFAVKEKKTPELVWNDETRQELQESLSAQIKNLRKSFYNILINFDYSVNQRELRVNDIFVRHYNNCEHEYRPNDIKFFAESLIQKLKDIVDTKYIADLNDNDSQNCIELVKAFLKLIDEGMDINDETFLQNLSTLCNLIKVEPDVEDKEIVDKQSIRLKEMSDHLLAIIKHIGSNFRVLNQAPFVQFLTRAFYCKEKEILDIDKIVEILQLFLYQQDNRNIQIFLIESGLIMFILNMIFDKQIQKRIRAELTKLMLKTSQSSKNIYRKYIPEYFFYEIEQRCNNDPEIDQLIEFLKDFDQKDFENVFIIWNSSLRKERHEQIKSNCERIIQENNEFTISEILNEPEIPNLTLNNELVVSNVILRIYNKNPAVFIGTNLNRFILDLSIQLQHLAQESFKIGQSLENRQQDSKGHKQLQTQDSHQQEQDNAKVFRNFCQKSLLILTALLLSIEQLLYNENNPNRLMVSKKEDKATESKFFSKLIEKITDSSQLDKNVYQSLGFALQQQVFLTQNTPIEIKLTFLQIILLMIDVENAMDILQENQTLLQFLTDSISRMECENDSPLLEDALILLIIEKTLKKVKNSYTLFQISTMNKLLSTYEKKKKLKKLIEFVLQQMAQHSQYKSTVSESINHYQPGLKIDINRILDPNSMPEYNQALQQIWRAKPNQHSDAKRIYDIDEGFFIEDKLNETNLLKIKLPLLSKKCVNGIRKEDIIEQPIHMIEREAKHLDTGLDYLLNEMENIDEEPIEQNQDDFDEDDDEDIEF